MFRESKKSIRCSAIGWVDERAYFQEPKNMDLLGPLRRMRLGEETYLGVDLARNLSIRSPCEADQEQIHRCFAVSPHFCASRSQTMFGASRNLFQAAALILFSFHLICGQTQWPRASNILDYSPEYGTQLSRASCLSALVQMSKETDEIFYHT